MVINRFLAIFLLSIACKHLFNKSIEHLFDTVSHRVEREQNDQQNDGHADLSRKIGMAVSASVVAN
jgi:hypothetical protein